MLPIDEIREPIEELPELTELDVVRHYTRLSQWNFSIDTNFYPLGSCTMKYNPKVHERAARAPEIAGLHPFSPASQGALKVIWEMEQVLVAISGMDGFTFQPAAGAQGEASTTWPSVAQLTSRVCTCAAVPQLLGHSGKSAACQV